MFRLGDLFRGSAPRPESDPAEFVAPGLRIAAAYAWRLLLVAGALGLFIWLVILLQDLVVPFLVAMLLAALLMPVKEFLVRHRWPLGLAVAVCVIGLLIIVAALVTLVVTQVRNEFPALQVRASEEFGDLLTWLQGPPLALSPDDIDTYLQQGATFLQNDISGILNGALSVGTTAGHAIAGVLLALFSLIFLLLDGGRIWGWVTTLFPEGARVAVNGSGRAGWITLSAFVRVQVFVAFVDAVGIGIGAWAIGIGTQLLGVSDDGFPLVIPIAVIVFLASFVPFVGAIVSGIVAVLVALLYLGPIPAIIMLGVVILVQQLESHILQPFVIGTAVRIHPLAVVLAVAAGGFVAGIPGTLFAVPLVALVAKSTGYLVRGDWRTNPNPKLHDLVPEGDGS